MQAVGSGLLSNAVRGSDMVMPRNTFVPSVKEYCCPHCGRPVKQSDLSDTENAYPFQCVHCDEDFYAFECSFIERVVG